MDSVWMKPGKRKRSAERRKRLRLYRMMQNLREEKQKPRCSLGQKKKGESS